jgi:transcription initiation factor TFIIIB Brf1 subunit/transcription initiation factor TFIIB
MKRILVCPVCKSKDIELDSGGYTGKYYCKKCGYVGSYILEMRKDEYKEFTEGEKISRETKDDKK